MEECMSCSQGTANKVLVVGLDGATFDVIGPMVEKGELPVLSGLMRSGSFGNLRSVPNRMSPAAWTSFMTGKNPGEHGIFDFFQRRFTGRELEFVNGSWRKGRSIWKIAGDAGRKVGVVNVPMTYPAEEVNGLLVAGMDAPGATSRGFTHPASLGSDLLRRFKDYVIEPRVMHLVAAKKIGAAVRSLCDTVEQRTAVAELLMQEKPWDLFTIVYRELDPAQHYFWKYMDPLHPEHRDEERRRFGDSVAAVYRKIDAAVGKLIEHRDENTTVVVLSDHGFGIRCLGTSCLNGWLEEAGYLRFLKKAPRMKRLVRSAYTRLERNLNQRLREALIRFFPGTRDRIRSDLSFSRIDWKNTTAYSNSITPAVWINQKGREPQGTVEAGAFEALRERLIREIVDIRDARTGLGAVERVWRREEIYSGPYSAMAPDLTLEWKEGALDRGIRSPGRKTALPFFPNEEQRRISGDHRLHGIVLFSGKDIRKGLEMDRAAIIDLAPTILQLLGIPAPSGMNGKVLEEIFLSGKTGA